MVPVNRLREITHVLVLVLTVACIAFGQASLPAQTLFGQSAARILRAEFSRADVSYLLLDANSGAVLASNWEDPQTPIPLGSLVKPFTALAFGERHALHFPKHYCAGTQGGCWLPQGHGEVDVAHAVAYSCNAYFRLLTASMTSADLEPIAAEFGFEPPPPGSSGPALAGLGGSWKISPLRAARAYLELSRRRDQPGVQSLIEGMRESALAGTGAEVDRSLLHTDALVKTGTAACTHSRRAPGDGFVVALSPATAPKVLLMVRLHGVPGAKAAKVVGAMLHRLEE